MFELRIPNMGWMIVKQTPLLKKEKDMDTVRITRACGA